MGLWPSFLPGCTGTDSHGVPLFLSANVMLGGFEEVFRGCYVGRYCGSNVGFVIIFCMSQKGLNLHLVP
jgi:hypothetical protein